MSDSIKAFDAYREKMNERILSEDHKGLKRFWSLDHQIYKEGALDHKSKEM